jgi:6-phosphogluconolactonase
MREVTLQVVGGLAAGAVIQLEGELVFGRAADPPADLGGDPALSRQHARVRRTNEGRILIEDLGSANGTYVNGTRINAPQLLSPGDRVELGDSVLQVATAAADRTQITPSVPGAGATRIAATPPVEPAASPSGPPTPPLSPVARSGSPLFPPGAESAPPAPPKRGPGLLVPVLAVIAILGIAGTIVGFATRTSKTKIVTVAAAASNAQTAPATGGSPAGGAASGVPGSGFVFSQSNNPKANSVYVFKRTSNGMITLSQTVNTGGKGTPHQQPFGLPIVDSQDSLVVSPNDTLLFVVNSGDNTVSSFRIAAGGIKLADIKPSGGILPISLAVHGNVLYVLDALSGNVMGYHFSATGTLTPIVGSAQPLSVVGPNGVAADIGFNPSGSLLLVTMRYLPLTKGTSGQPGLIDTFPVAADGSVGPALQTTAATPLPFGFRFLPSGIMVDTGAGRVDTPNDSPPALGDGSQLNGSLQTYSLASNGKLTPISNTASGGRAACWVALTPDDRYAFVTNTLSATAAHPAPGHPIGTGQSGLARYAVASNGNLTFLGNVNTGPGTPTDVAVSPDGNYLYMADPNPGLLPFGSHLEVYKIGSGGSLTLVQMTPKTLTFGVSGMAVS